VHKESRTLNSVPSEARPITRIDAAGLTHVGRHRPTNEDAYLIATLQRSMVVHDASPAAHGWFAGESAGSMLIVADGMGGQGGGDVASRVAVDTVTSHLLNCMPWSTVSGGPRLDRNASLPGVRQELSSALVASDQEVKTAGAQNGSPNMGTTLTMALVVWPVLYVAHVGDSRCYLLRGSRLERLTKDHTLAQRIAEESSESVAATSRLHHILWNSLGASKELPQPEITRREMQADDVLLLCSDGLTKHVTDAQLAATLSSIDSTAECCAALVEGANAAGGTDNITAVVAHARFSG
jgi:serine/threonine protein phosphatase PrpC